MTAERDDTVQMAGALETRVSDIFDRNAELEAMNDSLRAAYEAVASESDALRRALELRTRQRDAALRERDVYKQALTKIGMTTAEALRAAIPVQQSATEKVAVLRKA